MTESTDIDRIEFTPENAERRRRRREQLAYDVDWKLDMLFNLIFGIEDDHIEGSASITLVTAGGVIEGEAVHYRKYALAQIESVAEHSEMLASNLRIQHDAIVDSQNAIAVSDSDKYGATRGHLHFLEATLTNGAHRTTLSNLRVSAKSVIAWSIGARTYSD
ncbi:hypothetical protein [Paenarthrobacter nicotinovorans]|uniref:hypothetical protein n=1 Tax=Paenarthrobacter nicotinovorans TaxID=29320 RepID=UPI0009A8ADB1|nr:hypothetical protein [Paenarthrobacter nicotinovorans]MDI2021178.1 hypothetical protein [Paenarthrobacter nicotinovorans]SKB67381.1 hypothetical protein SAMN05660916_02063 [Arthrobacter sp. 31Cvi3.1E]